MAGVLLSWLVWATFGAPLPALPSVQAAAPNVVRSCTAYSGECRDLAAADLDPTVKLEAAAGRLAFVDEQGRLMEPTAEQLQEFRDLVYSEVSTRALSAGELSTLADGTQRLTFPNGFFVNLVVHRSTRSDRAAHETQEPTP